ncbi:MAG: chemotaxis protein CheB, partial [Candidatus Latescibacteria bacterium]|nr:chemotaxis protein CheB [Candidatus Latescibacterota bacterium]
SLGAFDFITKPEENDWKANQENLRTQLKDKLSSRVPTTTPILPPRAARPTAPQRPLTALVRIDLVAIGISTGGPKALAEVIPALPGSLRVPIVIVQHMPTMFTSALAQSLDSQSIVKVVEATTGLPLQPATVYIAPGGKQMRLAKQGALTTIEITDDPPENFCKPAVDYLFRSVAEIYGSRGLGVIMTGMGADGTQGLRAMKQQGSPVMAQDEATCVVYGMPQEAVKAGVVDTVLPHNKIAGEIARICTP